MTDKATSKASLALALMSFKQLLNVERQREKLEAEINATVTCLDEEDFAEYRRVTEELLAEDQRKRELAA